MISDLSPGDKLSLKGQLFELQKKLSLIELHKSALVDCSFTPNMIAKYDVANREENFYDNVSKAETIKKQKLAILKASLDKEESCTFKPQIHTRPRTSVGVAPKSVPGRDMSDRGVNRPSSASSEIDGKSGSTTGSGAGGNVEKKHVFNRLYEFASEYQTKQKLRNEHHKDHDFNNNKLFQPKLNIRSNEILTAKSGEAAGDTKEEESNSVANKAKGAGLYKAAIDLIEKKKRMEEEALKKIQYQASKPKINSQSEKWLKIKTNKECKHVFNYIVSNGLVNTMHEEGGVAEASDNVATKHGSALISLDNIRNVMQMHSKNGYFKSHLIDRLSIEIWGEITGNDELIEVVDFPHLHKVVSTSLFSKDSLIKKSSSSAIKSGSSVGSNGKANVSSSSNKAAAASNSDIITKYPIQQFYQNCLEIMNKMEPPKEDTFQPKINERSRKLAAAKDKKDTEEINSLLQSDSALKSTVISHSKNNSESQHNAKLQQSSNQSTESGASKSKSGALTIEDISSEPEKSNHKNDNVGEGNNDSSNSISDANCSSSTISKVEIGGTPDDTCAGDTASSAVEKITSKSQLMYARQVLKNKRLAEKRKENLDSQMQECTFRPTINRNSVSASQSGSQGNKESDVNRSVDKGASNSEESDRRGEDQGDDVPESSENKHTSVFSRLYSRSKLYNGSGVNSHSFSSDIKQWKENCTFSPQVGKLPVSEVKLISDETKMQLRSFFSAPANNDGEEDVETDIAPDVKEKQQKNHNLKLKNDSIKKEVERIRQARKNQEKEKEDAKNFGKFNEERYQRNRQALFMKGFSPFHSQVEERLKERSNSKSGASKSPKLLVDIKISPTKTIHIPIYHNDNPYQLAYSICKIYALDQRVEGVLAEAIRQSMVRLKIPIETSSPPDSPDKNDRTDDDKKDAENDNNENGRLVVDLNGNADNIDDLFDSTGNKNENPVSDNKQGSEKTTFKRSIFSDIYANMQSKQEKANLNDPDSFRSEDDSTGSRNENDYDDGDLEPPGPPSTTRRSVLMSYISGNSKDKDSSLNSQNVGGADDGASNNVDDFDFVDNIDDYFDNIELQADVEKKSVGSSSNIPAQKTVSTIRRTSISNIFGLGASDDN